MAHVTYVPVVLMLSFFQHKTLFSTGLARRQPDVVDELRLHNDLQVTKKESQVILYWNNNLTKEETEKYSVKYILSYTFFDTFQERKERLQEKKKRIRIELHTGFKAKVKTQVFMKETEDLIKESGWTECTYRSPPVYIQNLSCIIYNISFFNCTWHIKAEDPADVQYFFSYRHIEKYFECQQYIKNARNKNIGCHMKDISFQPLRKIILNISVVDLRNNSRRLSYYKGFTPQKIEKLNPPTNVSVSLENRSIKIHWKPPPTIGSREKKCFKYQVKITDSKIVDVSEEKYEYLLLRPAKKCTAQVRAKKEVCITNKIWSDWSEPVTIYDEETVDSILLSLTLFSLLIFLGSLLICACRRYRLLEVITMPFPGPTDKVTTWLATDETHHQKQNSVQMEMQSEVILRISEDNGDEDIKQHTYLKKSEDL
ncbi:interleukin-5 receptor subunit alpha-like isoform X1 [Tympanuchus pallidicinctus]|uniref:interleukin-5 receptor subunit alpha-like isoform X1 n=1 Tax=Tympanuchus pallidicinctus TaxID=109042 RepID=UPI0022873924|nr:interleukin-5 receptor subunit alpha-like isoform X1 [Tympanuchus pallidicinctus]